MVGPVELVGERRESVGRRWATRPRCPRGCPHDPQGSRRSVGLVHKSTGFSPCRGVANRSHSARCTMRSCRLGLTALDVAKQLVAGRVDKSCGGEVVERHSDAVELLEGDTGAKIALGTVERLQLQVRRGDVLEGVALPRAPLAIGGLDGEVAGTMVVQIPAPARRAGSH